MRDREGGAALIRREETNHVRDGSGGGEKKKIVKQVEVQKKKERNKSSLTGTESIRRADVSGRIHQKGEIGREAGAHVTRRLDFSQAAKRRVGFDAFLSLPTQSDSRRTELRLG